TSFSNLLLLVFVSAFVLIVNLTTRQVIVLPPVLPR
ncbi:MAG: hypothetical protein ACI8RD_003730, partial [Bacillariaceae sp.]